MSGGKNYYRTGLKSFAYINTHTETHRVIVYIFSPTVMTTCRPASALLLIYGYYKQTWIQGIMDYLAEFSVLSLFCLISTQYVFYFSISCRGKGSRSKSILDKNQRRPTFINCRGPWLGDQRGQLWRHHLPGGVDKKLGHKTRQTQVKKRRHSYRFFYIFRMLSKNITKTIKVIW